ncbi:amidohydrolase [Alicyclobacillus sendaiensis]|uniref:5-methylthioadenosine/S-adenosylhomocysteine deaminase n=1 Tax=Alicyclobacillus sendaiensis PA2 TaxID=3029425 RepID=A0ABT6Y1I9_ALISE|nr:amidohydrolase [Alicyclobacillus sendaiensis]MDI9260749.1 amidohydrolase [Alicyclobacillus sendaiensis PA2]
MAYERAVTVLEVGGAVVDSKTVYPGPAYFVIEGANVVRHGHGDYEPEPGEVVVRRWRKRNRIAIPGLVNAHGHAAMTLLRGVGDDLPLMTWLQERIFPLEARLTGECVYWGTQLACWEMLLSGTTAYADMYMMMDHAAEAAAESGMRALLSIGLAATDPEVQAERLAASRAFVLAWHGKADGRIQVALGPHAPYTCPEPFLSQIADLAAELGVGIQIHLSETRGEVDQFLSQEGLTPIGLAERAGLFQVPTLAAHCVHATQNDIEILRAHDVRVAHNPQSNLKLGSGIMPLPDMLSRGVTVGLGTDGAASNNNLDMFEEMRLAATLHKGVREDATSIDAATAFALATEWGARALFLPDGHGTLRAGAPCDMVLLDAHSPHFAPSHDLLSDLVYAAGADDVRDVMIAGEWVLQNREPTALDVERIRFEARRLKDLLTRA